MKQIWEYLSYGRRVGTATIKGYLNGDYSVTDSMGTRWYKSYKACKNYLEKKGYTMVD